MPKALALLTHKSKETLLGYGGTQSWQVVPKTVMRCEYVVMCRKIDSSNVHTAKEPHRTAFMIGKPSEVVPLADGGCLIRFAEYADVHIADVWPRLRNPVRYTTLEALGIDLKGVIFQPMPRNGAISRPASLPLQSPPMGNMAIARATVGAMFGVPAEQVDITIRTRPPGSAPIQP